MSEIIAKAEATHCLNKEEIIQILQDGSLNDEIFAAADRVREKYVGDEVHLRGLIEFSNICKQNCFYCGLRRDNKNVRRYRLDPETVLAYAKNARDFGYRTVVLQSGEDDSFGVAAMQRIIASIKKLDVAITLSIGEKSREEYRAYKEAGADRYLLRIETTDTELYERLDPGMSFENRLRCLYDLKDLGYEVGTGSLVGLPGQSLESIADDILFFKEFDADMIGLGPFIPNPQTPLAGAAGGTLAMSIKVMALVRLLMPDINIPATTAMETLDPSGRMLALQSGANVVMPNVTEGDFRKWYALYPGKAAANDTAAKSRDSIISKILSIGRQISDGYGYRQRHFKRPACQS